MEQKQYSVEEMVIAQITQLFFMICDFMGA